MGSAATISQITMDNGTAHVTNYPAAFSVYLSIDGINWGSPVATGAGSTQIISASFTAQIAQYVKVTLTATSPQNHWWSIAEFYISSSSI